MKRFAMPLEFIELNEARVNKDSKSLNEKEL